MDYEQGPAPSLRHPFSFCPPFIYATPFRKPPSLFRTISLTQKSSLKSFHMETFPLNIKNIIFMSLYSMPIFPLNPKLLGDICGFMSQWFVKQLIGIYQRHTSFLVRDMYICLCLGLDYVHVEYMNKCPQRPEEVFGSLGTGVSCNCGLGTQVKSSTRAVYIQLLSLLSSPYFMLYF